MPKEKEAVVEARSQRRILLASAYGCMLVLVGLIMVGMIPPPSAQHDPQWWLQFWGENVNLKRAGVILALIGASAIPGMVVVLSQQMRRVLGPDSAVAYVQLATGLLGFLVFLLLPLFLWSGLTYRPGMHDPDLMQALTDLSLFPFLFPWLGIVQFIMIAICVFKDTEGIVFPRWMGYVILWCAVALIPGGFIYFFKSGPMAWDGILAFWVGLVAVLVAIATLVSCLLRALSHEPRLPTDR